MKTKIFLAIALMVAIIAVAFAQNGKEDVAKFPNEVNEWEIHAEQGDTAALHKLLRYLDENAVIYVEVEEVISADGEDITDEVLNDSTTLVDEEFSNLCAAETLQDTAIAGKVLTLAYIRLHKTDDAKKVLAIMRERLSEEPEDYRETIKWCGKLLSQLE